MSTIVPNSNEMVSTDASCLQAPVVGTQTGIVPFQPIVQPVRPVNKIQAEVIIGIAKDITGSSGPFAEGTHRSTELILRGVSAKARAVRGYQVTYGDEDYGQRPVLITNDGTVEQVLADSARITYGGGGDEPEHHLSGIHELVRVVPWPTDPRKGRGAVVVFMTADTKPDASGMTARQLGKEIKARGLLCYLVCEPYPFAEEIVDAAQGLMFPITNNPDPAQMQRIAAQLSASILATVGAGATRPMTVMGNP
jgi:hypothetical protein